MMKAKFLIPFAIFVVLAGFLFKGLYLDPKLVPALQGGAPLSCRAEALGPENPDCGLPL